MTDIPNAVLSETFQARLRNRRVLSAIFTTFRFEPGFFETEILPVFFDVPLSHATPIKLMQIDELVTSLKGSIAVYYDQHGIVPEGGPAKLDVRRFPVRHPTGIFHPKNVLVLVEETEADANGLHPRALLCSAASANLTRAGWWENVEVAHIEEIGEGELTSLKDDLMAYVTGLVGAVEGRPINAERRRSHVAADEILSFLRRTRQREQRSMDGRFLPHFHTGDESVPAFIERIVGKAMRGCCLEVVSPYFDKGGESAPLQAIADQCAASEVRVFLPRNSSGDGLCPAALFDWVKQQPGMSWGSLPTDLLKMGKAEEAKARTVHAKVYRFFEPKRGGREILFVGSANLTSAACRLSGKGGNRETGFLVETTGKGRPDWWLTVEQKRPPFSESIGEDDAIAARGGTNLTLRYAWDTGQASACWAGAQASPRLDIRHNGVAIIRLGPLLSREWTDLSADDSDRLRHALASTSILEVVAEGSEPGLLLVQEDGMSHRPSLLLELSTADILRYWALLSVEQRAAFIEARASVGGEDDPIVIKLAALQAETTLFDRFAGMFHAFSAHEGRIVESLRAGNTKEATYRLFGKKHDSLGRLLDGVLRDATAGVGDRVEQYLATLCTKQLMKEVAREFADYWSEHRADVKDLNDALSKAGGLRAAIAAGSDEMPGFLDWFDRWFLIRAEAVQEES